MGFLRFFWEIAHFRRNAWEAVQFCYARAMS
jgi:hypothetical protein